MNSQVMIVAVAILACCPVDVARADDDLDGTWDSVYSEMRGKVLEGSSRTVVIHKGKYEETVRRTTHGKLTSKEVEPGLYHGEYEDTEGPMKGRPNLGIYRIKNDVLVESMAHVGAGVRPTTFESTKENGNSLAEWVRVTRGVNSELTKGGSALDGTWKLRKLIISGRDAGQEVTESLRKTYSGGTYVKNFEAKHVGDVHLDADGKFEFIGGTGGSWHGVYRLNEPFLLMSHNLLQLPAPTSFDSTTKDAAFLVILRRRIAE